MTEPRVEQRHRDARDWLRLVRARGLTWQQVAEAWINDQWPLTIGRDTHEIAGRYDTLAAILDTLVADTERAALEQGRAEHDELWFAAMAVLETPHTGSPEWERLVLALTVTDDKVLGRGRHARALAAAPTTEDRTDGE